MARQAEFYAQCGDYFGTTRGETLEQAARSFAAGFLRPPGPIVRLWALSSVAFGCTLTLGKKGECLLEWKIPAALIRQLLSERATALADEARQLSAEAGQSNRGAKTRR